MRVLSPVGGFLKSVRNGLVVAGIVLGTGIVCLLPRSIVWRIGRLCGWVGYHFAPTARRVARANLVLAFGGSLTETQRARIARQSMQNFAATLVMLFWAMRLGKKNLARYVEIDPDSHALLKRVAARGEGVIYATFHYGDWELAGLSMPLLDSPMTVAAQETRIARLDSLLSFCRSRTGNLVIPARRSLPKLLKAVHSAYCPAVLNDLNAKRNHGIWVTFFGLPVYNHPTVGSLAVRTGAPIVCGLAHPLGSGRSRLEWFEIPYSLSGDRDRDVEQINQACMDLAESMIRRHPEHWHWSYRRWKRRPTQELGRYPYYSKFCGERRPQSRAPARV